MGYWTVWAATYQEGKAVLSTGGPVGRAAAGAPSPSRLSVKSDGTQIPAAVSRRGRSRSACGAWPERISGRLRRVPWRLGDGRTSRPENARDQQRGGLLEMVVVCQHDLSSSLGKGVKKGVPPNIRARTRARGNDVLPWKAGSAHECYRESLIFRKPPMLTTPLAAPCRSNRPKISLYATLLGLLLASSARADDWPQWMGPQRDNVWREEGLLDKFPANGPTVVWSAPVAGGYAGPAVVGDRVWVTDYVTSADVHVENFQRAEFTGVERVHCLDAKSGKSLWVHEYPVTYGLSYPAGPRCTPTVHDGLVYTLGAEGHLWCLDAEQGTVVWSKELKSEYHTTSALWGYASHPLIDGDRLLCVVGGPGSHIVAFDRKTGNEVWRAQTAKEQGYSPPTIFTIGDTRQLVLLKPDGVAAVNPANGDEYWSVPYAATNGSIIMSPVRFENYLYAAGYSNKNLLLQLSDDGQEADVVWQDARKKGLSPVNVQPFLEDGVLYGFDQSGWLYAVELPSGKRLWEASPVSKRPAGCETAFLVKQGDRFWMFNENGELVIARLTRDGYDEIDRAKVIEPTNVAFGRDVVWCMPAFAGRRMYVRNDERLICVELAGAEAGK